MKLVITGAAGQLGQAFAAELSAQTTSTFCAFSRADLDITSAEHVNAVIVREQPDVVINTAAYTQVDLAVAEQDSAYLVNETGPANLAEACRRHDIPLIHFSTDYVFNGSKKGPWREDDATAPLNVYGASKFAGEEAIRQIHKKHLIFRSSWIFSEFGHNFVKTMLHVGSLREQISVVSDQIGKPTCARELAKLTLALLPSLDNQWGTYHLAQPQIVSWHGFAEEIFTTARRIDSDYWNNHLVVQQVKPILTKDYPTHAQRPINSALESGKFESTFGLIIKDWRQSLAETLGALQAND